MSDGTLSWALRWDLKLARVHCYADCSGCGRGGGCGYPRWVWAGEEVCVSGRDGVLFHHQIAICTENLKFRAETVVLVLGTKKIQFTAHNFKCSHPSFYFIIFIILFLKNISEE